MIRNPQRVLTASILLLLLMGCGSATPAPTTDGGTGSFVQSACGQCVEARCQSEVRSCEGDPGCATYLACLRACPVSQSGAVNLACELACAPVRSSEGRLRKQALIDCRTSGAGATCAQCGASAIVDPPTPAVLQQQCMPAMIDMNACYACEDKECCEGYARCKASTACSNLKIALGQCPGGVDEADCWIKEATANREGLALLAPRLACLTTKCVSTCGGGVKNPCEQCAITQCRNQKALCDADPDCWLIQTCQDAALAHGCADNACLATCRDRFPAGRALSESYATCIYLRCTSTCG